MRLSLEAGAFQLRSVAAMLGWNGNAALSHIPHTLSIDADQVTVFS
jgi:hypothetical protein